MKTKTKQLIFGILLVIVGIIVIYFNLKSFKAEFNKLWPSILLLFGLFFYVYYFSTKKKKNRTLFLFLASFLAVSSIPLYVLTFTSFDNINIVWPGFLFAFGIALISVYFFGNKKKITIIISSLSISASLLVWIFYMVKSPFGLVIAVCLILIGAAFITRGLIHDVAPYHITESNKIEDKVSEETKETNDNRNN